MSEKHDEKNTNWQKRSISKFLENEENAGGDGGQYREPCTLKPLKLNSSEHLCKWQWNTLKRTQTWLKTFYNSSWKIKTTLRHWKSDQHENYFLFIKVSQSLDWETTPLEISWWWDDACKNLKLKLLQLTSCLVQTYSWWTTKV